jgi:hypothetical protein
MQRKVILALLLLCTLTAWADKRGKKSSPKQVAPKGAAPQAASPNELNYRAIGAPMPPMRVVTADGNVITNETIANNANLFVMMFNPTCEHCEDMTRALESNLNLFRKSSIVLMAAPAMGPYLDYFDKTTHYTKYPALKVGLDSAKFIDHTFNYETLPQINIYDKDRRLIKWFSAINTIDSLRPYIQ